MSSPGPSATDIQSHLYSSFIHRSTSDVAIRVSGTWSARYSLHRVVLIQSGFFRSLFTAGFSESHSTSDDIHVAFDDFNVTRPAFEICISRLYGGGPALYLDPNLVPTTNYPLTPPFSGITEANSLPSGQQLATPRFLLSLLATAIYLSIPTVASQALSLVLKTVGPTTVLQYLDFACGKCFHFCDPIPEESMPAVGLDGIATLLDDSSSLHSTTAIEGLKSLSSASALTPAEENAISDDETDGTARKEPTYHYGAISNKIGEACASWLARWATDMLRLEDPSLDIVDMRLFSNNQSPVLHSISSILSPVNAKSPVIWGPAGLSAKWVSAVASADTLFVKNEKERYNFARSVVELRRRSGIKSGEEAIWSELFEHGIYYTNMCFDDILSISRDVSPTTKRPYVPMPVLQAAHWTQSTLRHQITSRSYSSFSQSQNGGSVSPPPRDKELGISLTTAELPASGASDDANQTYHPVLNDQSVRIGDGGGGSSIVTPGASMSMDELFSPAHSPAPHKSVRDSSFSGKITTTEESFFGILTARLTAKDCLKFDQASKMRWSPYPPFRFSVEFWDVDHLKEKSRLHSQTVWYAGSLFNIYVQLVRKKGQAQLGIYLHRQSHVDPIPVPSAPVQLSISQDAQTISSRHHNRQSSLPTSSALPPSHVNHYSPSIHPPIRSETPGQRYGTPPSPPSPASPPPPSIANFGSNLSTTNSSQHQPYRDPRAAISAYFSISCASATGSSQTRFTSAPDTFAVSQSWGWKSSSLRTEEFLDVGALPLTVPNVRGREASLRATVVLGLV